MHILEFKVNYEPEIVAGIALDANTAEDLALAGHMVHLYVPTPTRGVSQAVTDATPRFEKRMDGRLKIYRYNMYREGKNVPLRALRYVLCSIKQIWFGLREKDVDLVFAGSTPPFQGLICALIKKIRKVPFVFNLQDIFPDSMVSAGLTNKDSIICKIGSIISNVTYKAADKIIVISETMRDNLVTKGVDSKKIEIIYNWVDESVIYPVAKEDNKLISELMLPQDKFNVVYAGNLGYAQSIDTILHAAQILSDQKDISFVLFGNGAEENIVKGKIAENNTSNIKLYPLQPYERVSEVYSFGDACIVSCKKGTGGSAVPSKTWSIMGCGRAVLASFDENTLLEKIIFEENVGLFSPAEDAKALADNIIFLRDSREKCCQYGANARMFIEEKLTRKRCTDHIRDVIECAYREFEKN